jgi:hypothetical protein
MVTIPQHDISLNEHDEELVNNHNVNPIRTLPENGIVVQNTLHTTRNKKRSNVGNKGLKQISDEHDISFNEHDEELVYNHNGNPARTLLENGIVVQNTLHTKRGKKRSKVGNKGLKQISDETSMGTGIEKRRLLLEYIWALCGADMNFDDYEKHRNVKKSRKPSELLKYYNAYGDINVLIDKYQTLRETWNYNQKTLLVLWYGADMNLPQVSTEDDIIPKLAPIINSYATFKDFYNDVQRDIELYITLDGQDELFDEGESFLPKGGD